VKSSKRCPKCATRRFFVNEAVGFVQKTYKGEDPFVAKLPLVVRTEEVDGLWGPTTKLHPLGSFESWTCLSCGYTELYAATTDANEALAAGAGRLVEVGDQPPSR
jgi:predicted nucleic-acid-binding Zn-ribbon protein